MHYNSLTIIEITTVLGTLFFPFTKVIIIWAQYFLRATLLRFVHVYEKSMFLMFSIKFSLCILLMQIFDYCLFTCLCNWSFLTFTLYWWNPHSSIFENQLVTMVIILIYLNDWISCINSHLIIHLLNLWSTI